MKISTIRFLCCIFVAISLSLNSWAQTKPGHIKVARVENLVQSQSAEGVTTTLKNGDEVKETDTVITGKGASVVLVFMNGSSVKIGADSKLAIDEFKMDPLAETINPSTLKAEPSVSKTALNLAYGEMVGDVKKLNTASSYSIKTPVGAAGIRGTIYRIVFRPASNGKAFFTIATADGTVVMQGVTTTDIPVEAGKEVVVEIDVPDTGQPGPPVIVTQNISPETAALIRAATQSIALELQSTNFTVAEQEAIVIPETPPPETVAPLQQLTPGAGG